MTMSKYLISLGLSLCTCKMGMMMMMTLIIGFLSTLNVTMPAVAGLDH